MRSVKTGSLGKLHRNDVKRVARKSITRSIRDIHYALQADIISIYFELLEKYLNKAGLT
jgi:hypothetical protein